MRNRFLQAIEGGETAKDKLFALLEVARHAPREEAFHGGCPVMNLAVESDDADPKLITCLIALRAASRSYGAGSAVEPAVDGFFFQMASNRAFFSS